MYPRSSLVCVSMLLAFAASACSGNFGEAEGEPLAEAQQELKGGQLPNNFPFLNNAGLAATFSSAGFVDLESPFHVPQGKNGRSCSSCHLVEAGWSIRPFDVEV